jgi:hypothetical protein
MAYNGFNFVMFNDMPRYGLFTFGNISYQSPLCKGITLDNELCKNPMTHGSSYCKHHNPNHYNLSNDNNLSMLQFLKDNLNKNVL